MTLSVLEGMTFKDTQGIIIAAFRWAFSCAIFHICCASRGPSASAELLVFGNVLL